MLCIFYLDNFFISIEKRFELNKVPNTTIPWNGIDHVYMQYFAHVNQSVLPPIGRSCLYNGKLYYILQYNSVCREELPLFQTIHIVISTHKTIDGLPEY